MIQLILQVVVKYLRFKYSRFNRSIIHNFDSEITTTSTGIISIVSNNISSATQELQALTGDILVQARLSKHFEHEYIKCNSGAVYDINW